MGKIACAACKKSCKGQAVRLQERYFHVKCFKCKECKKQLAAGGFYAKDDNYYCAEDYQRLFGTKCTACGKYVEGEVITALGATYHQNCFHCTRCNNKFGAGDKVTFNGSDYLCNNCLEKAGSTGRRGAKSPTRGPVTAVQKGRGPTTSTPAKPERVILERSPLSDTSDGEISSDMPLYPGYHNGPLSPISIQTSEDESLSPTNKGRLSPVQQFMQYRSPSPVDSTVSRSSRKSRDSSGSFEPKYDVDYGRFYKQSYLKENKPFMKGPSINPNFKPTSPNFHKPDNFSYKQVRRDFVRPMKKETSMLSTLGDNSTYQTKRKMDSIVPMNNDEAIKLSRFPDAHRPERPRPAPIEREDWPGPPAPAAAYPELLRYPYHRMGGMKSHSDGEEEPEDLQLDPKIQKELEELSKIPDSGVGKIILNDMKKKRSVSPTLDPRSASRTPSADHEPHYKTRYESPLFASPSRDLDYRPRLKSMDDEILEIKKYRTSTLPISNFPVDRVQYEEPVHDMAPNIEAPKPGYGLSPKSATLPESSRNGAPNYAGYDYESAPEQERNGGSGEGLDRRSYHTSQSSMEEYDPETGLRKSRHRYSARSSSSNFANPQYIAYRRSMPSMLKSEDPPVIYPYEQLKITNYSLPPGVDRNSIELHLSRDEFESIFHLTRQQFYRLAEWKRNDLKKRVGLF